MYLGIIVETGWVGFACFAAFLGAALLGLREARRRIADPELRALAEATQLAFVGYLIAVATVPAQTAKHTWILIALAVVGYSNTITSGANGANIAGGEGNTIGWPGWGVTIGGGQLNEVSARVAVIAGGIFNLIEHDGGFIGGGSGNKIAGLAYADGDAVIAGGLQNTIQTSSSQATIGGGRGNGILNDSDYATIAGGLYHDIGTNSDSSAIGGGYDNNIAANSGYATIAGGYGNIATNSYATVGGGWQNRAYGYTATVSGGATNTASARRHEC